jgi:DNA-binding HxlR family transcriptional regulator
MVSCVSKHQETEPHAEDATCGHALEFPVRVHASEAAPSNDDSLEIVPTIFIGKWAVKIVAALKERPHRHGELQRRLESVSQRMLTKTLRDLESAGLITRCVTQFKPLAVEYSPTKLGLTFLVPLNGFCRWARRHNTHLNAIVRLVEMRWEEPL